MLKISQGITDKSNGFIIALSYLSTVRACTIIGIFKRPQWYINNRVFSCGYLFININYFLSN